MGCFNSITDYGCQWVFLVPKAIRAEYPAAYLPGGGILLFCAYHFGDKIK